MIGKSINQYEKTTCRYCDSALEESFLELGTMALANSFISVNQVGEEEFSCPLNVTQCSRCTLVQLTHAVPPEIMFSEYLYVSSTTKTFRDHFEAYAQAVRIKLFAKDKLVAVDIGSNDGLLLSYFQKERMKPIGVEPAKNLSDLANKKGLKTINRFFDSSCVDEILNTEGHAHAISANNVFAHIDNIQAVCQNVSRLLDDQGLFVIEFPYLITMMDSMLFDMIYHEHLSYISINALNFVLNLIHTDPLQ